MAGAERLRVAPPGRRALAPRRVLDAGSGGLHADRRMPVFAAAGWEQVTVDVDPAMDPDHVGSVADMRGLFADGSFDAVWSSHTIEHLYLHELKAALAEFRRVLRPDGFALLSCPDLEAVAAAVVAHGLDHTAYVSPAGPITLLDILYGHGRSIERGATAMAHRTGLTADQLGALSLAAGFAEVAVAPLPNFELWAVLCCPETDRADLRGMLAGTAVAFLVDDARP